MHHLDITSFKIPAKVQSKLFTRDLFFEDTKHSCYIFCGVRDWFLLGKYMPPALCLRLLDFLHDLYVMGCQEKSCISYTFKNNNPSKQLFILVLNCKAVNKSDE